MTRWRLWQWMLLGLFLGALGGYVRTMIGPGFDSNIDVTLNPLVFEQYVLDGRAGRKQVTAVRDLTVHPPFDETGVDWVTGVATLQYNERENRSDPQSPMKRWEERQPFRFSIKVPYAAQRQRGEIVPLEMGDLSQYPDNQAYLRAFIAKFPDAHLSYRYAWWDAPKVRIGLWTVGGLIVFGLIIPFFARLISPPPPREPKVKLAKVRASKPQPVGPTGPSDADVAQLDALEAHLAKSLEGAFPQTTESAASNPPAAAPIRQLSNVPTEQAAQPLTPPEQPREYAGEFYPTVAHAPKQEKDDKS